MITEILKNDNQFASPHFIIPEETAEQRQKRVAEILYTQSGRTWLVSVLMKKWRNNHGL
jgi:hypothetical protein